MKYTVKDICCLFNCHVNTVYPVIKKLKPFFLLGKNKDYLKTYELQQVMAIVSHLNKPKKEFILPYSDDKIIVLATILNNTWIKLILPV